MHIKKIAIFTSVILTMMNFSYGQGKPGINDYVEMMNKSNISTANPLNQSDYIDRQIQETMPKAKAGVVSAQRDIGVLSERKKDYKTAAYWYDLAAKGGNGMAAFELANLDYNGHINLGMAEYLRLLMVAAESDVGMAQYRLGIHYQYGIKVQADYSKARYWYERATKRGSTGAFTNLGIMYKKGIGVPTNYEKAIELFKEAIERGNLDAQFELAEMFEMGLGVEKNIELAASVYSAAAKAGNSNAQTKIGIVYLDLENYKEAIYWLTEAVKNDHPIAQFYLGIIYLGGYGVNHDIKKAKEYFKKSCDNNYEAGCKSTQDLINKGF